MKLKTTVAAVIAAVMMAGGGQAATCSVAGNGNSGKSFTLTPDDVLVPGPIESDVNPSCIAGNDDGDNGFFDDGTLWGVTDWKKGDKPQDGSGDKVVSFSLAPIIGDSSGSWTVNDYNAANLMVALVLKGGNGFAAFLLDGDPLTGLWSSSADLSHASIWYSGEATPVEEPSPVPLPAAGWLLLAGIGGLAALRRRKSV